jgi:hypothetical protein
MNKMNKMVIVVYFLLVLIPALPLSLTWRQVLTRRDSFASSSSITVKLPLLVTTVSCRFCFLSLLFPAALGPDYSNRRFVTIWINLGLTLLMVAFSLRGKNQFKVLLAIAAGAVALVWLYAWGASAAV